MTSSTFDGRRDWPAIRLATRRPLDWSTAGALTIAVDNPAAAPFKLLLRIDDSATADGDERSLSGVTEIAAHGHGVVVLPLDGPPIGMRARPPSAVRARPGDLVITTVVGAVDLHHVVALHISGVRSGAEQALRIGPPALRDKEPGQEAGGPIVDGFGQAIAGDWPEKVTDVADLRRRLAAAGQQTRRRAASAAPAADAYGGIGRPRFAATGAFRVEEDGGRWTFVTPTGRPFYSLGVDAVTASNPTVVEGRRQLFADLPPAPNVAGRLFGVDSQGRTTFDIGQADLDRGFGGDWRARWRDDVLTRLRAWGFNTLGNWSEASLTTRATMPFVSFTDVEGASAEVPMEDGRHLPDPFDPAYPGVADAVARTMTAATRDDPFLLGYFSGNEMPWGQADRPESGLAAHVLTLGPDGPAKRALIATLRTRYATPDAFSTAWALTGLRDWPDALVRRTGWPVRFTAAARDDIVAFQAVFAARYFRTVAEAIRRWDPRHLYLGVRFADAPPEVVRACARWCDVLSFNVYGTSPEEQAAAWRPFHRPVLIGEFHFGSSDRGSFWPGMVDVGREDRRGPAYAAYLAAALQDADIVGCHWYQYADEPVTGRPYDGENGHIGLVAVTGLPYAGFVADVAAANRRTLATFARWADGPAK